MKSFRWIPVLVVGMCAVAHAQYGPPPPQPYPYAPPPGPPPGYGPGPTYGQPVSYAQPARGRIELTGFAGYQLSTDAGTCCGTIVIDGSAVYGAALAYQLHARAGIEFSWFYVPTNVAFRGNGFGVASSDGKAGVGEHWFQIGAVSGFRRGRLEPYGTLTAGLVFISPGALRLTDGSTLTPQSQVEFAFTAGVGLKVWVTDMIALRFDVRALVPVYFQSAGFYVGTGGTGVGVSGGLPWAQFAFTGGLVVAF